MTSRSLEIFAAVADCGRMTEAAKKLFVTQSSVSQAIADIEKEYGVLLFERMSHNLYLTEAGRELYRYAKEYLSIWREMDDFLKYRTKCTNIYVGGTPTVGSSVLSPITWQLKQQMPGVKVTIDVDNTKFLEDKLMRNELDIALMEGSAASQDLIVEPCMDDLLVLICAQEHRFWGREQVCLADLAGETFVLREKGSGTRARIESQLAERKIPYTVSGSCTNIGAIKNGVLYNQGIGVISRRVVQREVISGILWACPIVDGDFSIHFNLVYHKNKYFTEAMNAFVMICREFSEQERNGTARSRNMLTLNR